MYLVKFWRSLRQWRIRQLRYFLTGRLSAIINYYLFCKLPELNLHRIALSGGLGAVIVALVILSLFRGAFQAVLDLFIFSSFLLLFWIGVRRIEILCLQKRLKTLFKKVQSTYTEGVFTAWQDWPLETHTRQAIQAARGAEPNQELVIGHIDNDGRALGLFGRLPGFKNVSEADFIKRPRFLFDIVLVDGKVLVRKDFGKNKFDFVHECRSLLTLYGKANVSPIYKVDENRCWLYRNLIHGQTVRDVLVDAGAKILTEHTKNDSELTKLDGASRIEAVWAKGREYIQACFSEKFMPGLEEQLDKMHACGVTGASLTFGNIIQDFRNGAYWFIDFNQARVHRSTSSPIFIYRRNQDRVKFNRIYGQDLMTEQSVREALAKYVGSEPGWYAPIDFGGGLAIGGFWSIESGTGRWEFLNKNVLVPLVAGKRILDLGCNNGAMSMMMLRSGAREAIGVEILSIFVERAKLIHKIFEWRDMRRYSFQVYNCNMLEILHADWGKFDVVTAFASLYYLPADDMAKVTGKASELAPIMVLQAKADTRSEAAEDKARKSSVGFLKKLLEDNGFAKVEIFTRPNYNRPLLVGRRISQ